MFDTDNYHNEIQTVVKETGEVFSDKFSIHFFELKKVSKRLNPSNRRDLWLQFLNADKEEEFEMIKQTSTVMEKAVNVIYDMSEYTRLKEAARLREKMMHDETSALGFAERKGLKKGIEIGIEQAKNQLVQLLQTDGFTEEQINNLINRME